MPPGSFNDGSSIDAYNYNYAWAYASVVLIARYVGLDCVLSLIFLLY